jgi:hypothetical protein
VLGVVEVVYYTGRGGIFGFHGLPTILTAALLLGAAYGFLRLLHDAWRLFNPSGPPPPAPTIEQIRHERRERRGETGPEPSEGV